MKRVCAARRGAAMSVLIIVIRCLIPGRVLWPGAVYFAGQVTSSIRIKGGFRFAFLIIFVCGTFFLNRQLIISKLW